MSSVHTFFNDYYVSFKPFEWCTSRLYRTIIENSQKKTSPEAYKKRPRGKTYHQEIEYFSKMYGKDFEEYVKYVLLKDRLGWNVGVCLRVFDSQLKMTGKADGTVQCFDSVPQDILEIKCSVRKTVKITDLVTNEHMLQCLANIYLYKQRRCILCYWVPQCLYVFMICIEDSKEDTLKSMFSLLEIIKKREEIPKKVIPIDTTQFLIDIEKKYKELQTLLVIQNNKVIRVSDHYLSLFVGQNLNYSLKKDQYVDMNSPS